MSAPHPSPTFAAVIEPVTGRLHLRGELDAQTAPLLWPAAEEARALSPRELVLDLAGLDFLGAAGLDAFVALARRDRRPRFVGVTPRQRRIFTIGSADWLLDESTGSAA